MKIVVLYQPNSDHYRTVEQFHHDISKLYGADIELVSLDTRQGSETAALYDITQYPAVIALDNELHMLQTWQGEMLPRVSDVTTYLQNSFSSHSL
jgi:hypothetical protein